MKAEMEFESGHRFLKLVPEDTYDAYQLGILSGSGVIAMRPNFVVSDPRQLVCVKFTMQDLCDGVMARMKADDIV